MDVVSSSERGEDSDSGSRRDQRLAEDLSNNVPLEMTARPNLDFTPGPGNTTLNRSPREREAQRIRRGQLDSSSREHLFSASKLKKLTEGESQTLQRTVLDSSGKRHISGSKLERLTEERLRALPRTDRLECPDKLNFSGSKLRRLTDEPETKVERTDDADPSDEAHYTRPQLKRVADEEDISTAGMSGSKLKKSAGEKDPATEGQAKTSGCDPPDKSVTRSEEVDMIQPRAQGEESEDEEEEEEEEEDEDNIEIPLIAASSGKRKGEWTLSRQILATRWERHEQLLKDASEEKKDREKEREDAGEERAKGDRLQDEGKSTKKGKKKTEEEEDVKKAKKGTEETDTEGERFVNTDKTKSKQENNNTAEKPKEKEIKRNDAEKEKENVEFQKGKTTQGKTGKESAREATTADKKTRGSERGNLREKKKKKEEAMEETAQLATAEREKAKGKKSKRQGPNPVLVSPLDAKQAVQLWLDMPYEATDTDHTTTTPSMDLPTFSSSTASIVGARQREEGAVLAEGAKGLDVAPVPQMSPSCYLSGSCDKNKTDEFEMRAREPGGERRSLAGKMPDAGMPDTAEVRRTGVLKKAPTPQGKTTKDRKTMSLRGPQYHTAGFTVQRWAAKAKGKEPTDVKWGRDKARSQESVAGKTALQKWVERTRAADDEEERGTKPTTTEGRRVKRPTTGKRVGGEGGGEEEEKERGAESRFGENAKRGMLAREEVRAWKCTENASTETLGLGDLSGEITQASQVCSESCKCQTSSMELPMFSSSSFSGPDSHRPEIDQPCRCRHPKKGGLSQEEEEEEEEGTSRVKGTATNVLDTLAEVLPQEKESQEKAKGMPARILPGETRAESTAMTKTKRKESQYTEKSGKRGASASAGASTAVSTQGKRSFQRKRERGIFITGESASTTSSSSSPLSSSSSSSSGRDQKPAQPDRFTKAFRSTTRPTSFQNVSVKALLESLQSIPHHAGIGGAPWTTSAPGHATGSAEVQPENGVGVVAKTDGERRDAALTQPGDTTAPKHPKTWRTLPKTIARPTRGKVVRRLVDKPPVDTAHASQAESAAEVIKTSCSGMCIGSGTPSLSTSSDAAACSELKDALESSTLSGLLTLDSSFSGLWYPTAFPSVTRPSGMSAGSSTKAEEASRGGSSGSDVEDAVDAGLFQDASLSSIVHRLSTESLAWSESQQGSGSQSEKKSERSEDNAEIFLNLTQRLQSYRERSAKSLSLEETAMWFAHRPPSNEDESLSLAERPLPDLDKPPSNEDKSLPFVERILPGQDSPPSNDDKPPSLAESPLVISYPHTPSRSPSRVAQSPQDDLNSNSNARVPSATPRSLRSSPQERLEELINANALSQPSPGSSESTPATPRSLMSPHERLQNLNTNARLRTPGSESAGSVTDVLMDLLGPRHDNSAAAFWSGRRVGEPGTTLSLARVEARKVHSRRMVGEDRRSKRADSNSGQGNDSSVSSRAAVNNRQVEGVDHQSRQETVDISKGSTQDNPSSGKVNGTPWSFRHSTTTTQGGIARDCTIQDGITSDDTARDGVIHNGITHNGKTGDGSSRHRGSGNTAGNEEATAATTTTNITREGLSEADLLLFGGLNVSPCTSDSSISIASLPLDSESDGGRDFDPFVSWPGLFDLASVTRRSTANANATTVTARNSHNRKHGSRVLASKWQPTTTRSNNNNNKKYVQQQKRLHREIKLHQEGPADSSEPNQDRATPDPH